VDQGGPMTGLCIDRDSRERYVTPENVVNYILDPTIPASNFLCDACDAIMSHPKYERESAKK
jgi:hypothetical protein